MKITEQVMIDLLPLYLEGEASEDTVKLMEAFFKEHPEFEKEAKNIEVQPMHSTISIKPDNELEVLNRTKSKLKLRSVLMGLAIFFTAFPFTFSDVLSENGGQWLWAEFPIGAYVTGSIGVICWILYYFVRKDLESSRL